MVSEQSEVPVLLAELVSDMGGVLGEDLIGIYVYGSYVSGGFDAGVSDLDLVAVTARDAAGIDLGGLARIHAAFASRHPTWSDRIETVYIGKGALGSFQTSSEPLAVISPGEPFHLRDDPVSAWVQNWYLVRKLGVTLFGPPPTSLIPPVDWSEFVAESRHYAADIAAKDLEDVHPAYLAYTVLTMCRAQQTILADVYGSKQEAAAWARERDPDRAWLLDAALRSRLSRGTVGFDDEETRAAAIEFIKEMARRIDTPGSA